MDTFTSCHERAHDPSSRPLLIEMIILSNVLRSRTSHSIFSRRKILSPISIARWQNKKCQYSSKHGIQTVSHPIHSLQVTLHHRATSYNQPQIPYEDRGRVEDWIPLRSGSTTICITHTILDRRYVPHVAQIHVHPTCHIIACCSHDIWTVRAPLDLSHCIFMTWKLDLTEAANCRSTCLGALNHSTIPDLHHLVNASGCQHKRPILVPIEGEQLGAGCRDGQD